MGVLKQQREMLSELFYNHFKIILFEEKSRHPNKVIVSFTARNSFNDESSCQCLS